MKKLFSVLFVAAFCNVLTAADILTGKIAVGYSDAPTIRYWLSEKIGLEGKFSLRWNNSSDPSFTYKNSYYSISAIGIYNIKKTKIVNFNANTLIGYSYEDYKYSYINSAGLYTGNYLSNKKNSYYLGIGPEFEVFIPPVPNLSLSSSILLYYSYRSNSNIFQFYKTKYISREIYFSGDGFTVLGLSVRYYFN